MKAQEKQKKEENIKKKMMINMLKQNKRNNTNSISVNYNSISNLSNSKYKCSNK